MKITDHRRPEGSGSSAKVISYPAKSFGSPHVRPPAGGNAAANTGAVAEHAAERIKAMSDVDVTRVARIKAMLRTGTFKVESDKAAAEMLIEALLADLYLPMN